MVHPRESLRVVCKPRLQGFGGLGSLNLYRIRMRFLTARFLIVFHLNIVIFTVQNKKKKIQKSS